MLLSDSELREAIESGEFSLTPVDLAGGDLQPASIDLHLAPDIRVQSREEIPGVTIDPEELDFRNFLERNTDRVDISDGWDFLPGSFVLGSTVETLHLPLHLSGRVEGRSRLARLGVGVHITAPKIDPGFHNPITLEIYNLGPWTLRLRAGMRICSLMVERLGRPAERGYQGIFQNTPTP